MRSILVTVLLGALAACAGTPSPNYRPISTSISIPPLGQETTVSLGEDMVTQGIYTETEGVELSAENNIQGYRLSAGFYPQIAVDKNYTYHSFEDRRSRDGSGYLISGKDIFGLPLAIPQSIRASKSKQETCVIVGGMSGKSCDTEHSFMRTRKPTLSERDLQQTLIYSGRIGNKIKIGYRETSGNYARSAFSNEAEYDLNTSNEIAYRGARIKILESDNQKIRYVVLSNFNTK